MEPSTTRRKQIRKPVNPIKRIPGSKPGPCWGNHCRGIVWYPPTHITAVVQCTSEFPHTATVRPATNPKEPKL